jgi:hypothetical protein
VSGVSARHRGLAKALLAGAVGLAVIGAALVIGPATTTTTVTQTPPPSPSTSTVPPPPTSPSNADDDDDPIVRNLSPVGMRR